MFIITVFLREKLFSSRFSRDALAKPVISLGTIIIHISEGIASPNRSRSLSIYIPKSSSFQGKTLIRTSRDEIMRNLGARRTNAICISVKIYRECGSRGGGKAQREDKSRGEGGREDCGYGIFRGRPWICTRCGRPDTPNSLSRSNLIERPQRLYGRPCIETDNVCIPHARDKPRNAHRRIPVHIPLLRLSLLCLFLPLSVRTFDSLGSRQCCSIRHCSNWSRAVQESSHLTLQSPLATLLL